MKKTVVVFFLLLIVFFFYKTFFLGMIPFSGDLLVSEYNPWKSYSFLGYNPGSIPNKFQYFDTLRQLYPWKTFTISQIKALEIPLWSPYSFSGYPLFANFQSAVFYPLNIFYLIFPQLIGWVILVVLQPFLAGIFSYLFVREIGVSKKGSILSSIAFSFSLFMTVFLEYNTVGHVILWLPLVLYSVEKIIKKRTIYNLSLFVLGLVLSFFAGHLQLFGFVFIFVCLYIIFRLIQEERKIDYFLLFIFLLTAVFGICAVQLLPTLELIGLSARSAQPYKYLVENLLIQPQQLILFISPDIFGNPSTNNYLLSDSYPGNSLYIGLIPLIFSIFSINIWRNKFIKFFLPISIILILFFVRSPITELFYKIQIPFFSSGSPTNAIFLLSFSLSILAGFGFDYWTKEKKIVKLITIFLVFFILTWIIILIFHPSIIIKNFIYSTILFVSVLFLFILGYVFDKNKKIIPLFFILITIFDLFYFFQKFNPFVSMKLVFPNTAIINFLSNNSGINRFWGYGFASVEANFSTQYNLFSTDGYDPLYPKRYGEFIQSSKNGKISDSFNNQNRSDAVIAPGFGEKNLMENASRLRVMDALGIKYILDRVENGSTEKTFPADRFKQIYDNGGWKIFENLKASPRIFLASDYRIANTKQDFEKYFFDPVFDPTKTVILEKAVNVEKDKVGKVNLISYDSNLIKLKTNAGGSMILFLSDSFYPGWKAYVDNKETEIYRADYAFRSIVVPYGEHNIVFRYSPPLFDLGVKISIISSVLFILVTYMLKNKGKLS